LPLPSAGMIQIRFSQYRVSLWVQRGWRHPLSAFCLSALRMPTFPWHARATKKGCQHMPAPLG